MTRFVPSCARATNNPPPYVTSRQVLFSAADLAVQVIPSVEVITRFVPLPATATNNPFPYVTLYQVLATGFAFLVVQVIPSGDVITFPDDPPEVLETATNNPFPYVTLNQLSDPY